MAPAAVASLGWLRGGARGRICRAAPAPRPRGPSHSLCQKSPCGGTGGCGRTWPTRDERSNIKSLQSDLHNPTSVPLGTADLPGSERLGPSRAEGSQAPAAAARLSTDVWAPQGAEHRGRGSSCGSKACACPGAVFLEAPSLNRGAGPRGELWAHGCASWCGGCRCGACGGGGNCGLHGVFRDGGSAQAVPF